MKYFITMFMVLLGVIVVHSQEEKFTAYNGAIGDEFGESVSIDGNVRKFVAGAFLDNHFGEDNGSAYLFMQTGSQWSFEEHLSDPDWDHDALMGKSISISGDVIAVGTPFSVSGGFTVGSICVFTAPSYTFSRIEASDASEGDYFGETVYADGDYIIVGARGDDDFGHRTGSAYVYQRSENNWSEQAKLLSSDAHAEQWFGCSVCIDGNKAIVGAFHDDTFGEMSGAAYIFHRSGGTWTEQVKLTASDASSDDRFGRAVAISGNYAVVGSWFDDDDGENSGSAYVYHYSNGGWNEQAKLTPSDGALGDHFGGAVAIDGDIIAVGSPSESDAKGAVYLYRRDGNSWYELRKQTASDGTFEDYYGWSVNLSGDYLIVGSPWDDDNGENSGSAYLYSDITTSIEESNSSIPEKLELSGNYPNPFNAQTTIEFSLPEASQVNFDIYNLLGEKVEALINKQLLVGIHQITWNAKDVSSGIYFYKIQAGDYSEMRTMVLLK